MYKFLCRRLFSFLLRTYLRVELLGYMLILYLTFGGTARVFSTAAAPSFVPASGLGGFCFLPISANTCYYISFDCGHPSGCEVVSLWFCVGF